LAPPRPESRLHSLPPILGNVHQIPMSSCSKGSRGLSVFLRVIGIFTDTTISPSPSLRQRSSRYAIRAGRNLPDKEFRYLRTVHSCYYGGRLSPPRLTHFWSALMVAHEIGLSHLATQVRWRARRIVSEDSLCRLAALTATIHLLSEGTTS